MKRCVCCLDGTWNADRAGTIPTNVVKLHRAISEADAQGTKQIAHYIEGIASGEGERGWFLKGAVGFGVSDRIRRAYEWLSSVYEPGDEIHLYAFSRGAFAARSLTSFMAIFGLARPSAGFSYETAWALYRRQERRRDAGAIEALRRACHHPVRIKCLGLWDTVGNLGNPLFQGAFLGRRNAFHDLRLADHFDVGLHALAIDELRGPFSPSLWTMPARTQLPSHQHIEQVWFPGSHADIGGGFREPQLADVTLRWMAERASATTGIAIDMARLKEQTRPDPLGPQHSSTVGSLFGWSKLLPLIRLVRQSRGAIPLLRRALLGGFRSGAVSRGETTVNESVHDSVRSRLGRRVIELLGDNRYRTITYAPANLAAAGIKPAEEPSRSVGKRRIKLFTVHGTFAHETDWDDWDEKDERTREPGERRFVNRLSEHLAARGVVLEKADHSQYNWSGGNSHDERRVAAIGLKKRIDEELREAEARHGKDYYDRIYVVGHSHGGTVARLAMNLWDKDDDYYEPAKDHKHDELKADDRCPTCMRTRNGRIGPARSRRPDAVFTFGSPFVTFRKRKAGLLAASLGAWAFRGLAVLPLVALYIVYAFGGLPALFAGVTPPWMQAALQWTWPAAAYALWVWLSGALVALAERLAGRGTPVNAAAAFGWAVRIGIAALGAAYYLALATGGMERALAWLPLLGNPFLLDWLWWLLPFVLFWLLAVTLPGRFLSWMSGKVIALRDRLPRKYDPAEDRPVPFLSYHTPGDEAGLHLRAFGFITWLVQTLGLAAATVLLAGVVLVPFVAIEMLGHYFAGGSLVSRLGISALSPDPVLKASFVAFMDWLTAVPAAIWATLVDGTTPLTLGSLANAQEVVPYIPRALILAIAVVFLVLMPPVLLALGLAWFASIQLRGSGAVFGSERFTWTMANRIAVTRRATETSMLRTMLITPEAWWRRELAHCYYYKSDRVIADLAGFMSGAQEIKPTRTLPVGELIGSIARLGIVALSVLGIFAAAVPIARHYADEAARVSANSELIESPTGICQSVPHSVALDLQLPADLTFEQKGAAVREAARQRWLDEVTEKHGAEWAGWAPDSASYDCTGFGGRDHCNVSAPVCKPKVATPAP